MNCVPCLLDVFGKTPEDGHEINDLEDLIDIGFEAVMVIGGQSMCIEHGAEAAHMIFHQLENYKTRMEAEAAMQQFASMMGATEDALNDAIPDPTQFPDHTDN